MAAFDNIVISRYNQLQGRGAFQSDRVRQLVLTDPAADPEVVERVREARVDIGATLDLAQHLQGRRHPGVLADSCAAG